MDFLERVFVRKTSNSYVQFLRYGFVSSVALAVDFGGLIFLVEYLHVHYLLAASVSFMAGLIVNYLLSVFWVFHDSKLTNKLYEFTSYAIIGAIGLGLTAILLWALKSGLGLHLILAKAITTILVFFWNFGARKKFLFN